MIRLKNRNWNETKKLKLWQNTKTHIVMNLQNSNCDETQTQIVMKFKNSNGDKTQKLKLWQNSKIQMWQNSICDKTPIVTKLQLWQYSSCDKTQIVTKLKLGEKKEEKKPQMLRILDCDSSDSSDQKNFFPQNQNFFS